jgi:hypothetical protein
MGVLNFLVLLVFIISGYAGGRCLVSGLSSNGVELFVLSLCVDYCCFGLLFHIDLSALMNLLRLFCVISLSGCFVDNNSMT